MQVTTGRVVCRGSEIGVVEDVEKIRSRLKREALPEFELPAQRQVDLGRAESAQGISSQGSLPRRGGYAECRSTDSLSAGRVRICNPESYSRIQIRTRCAEGSRQGATKRIPSGYHIHRGRSSSIDDRIR